MQAVDTATSHLDTAAEAHADRFATLLKRQEERLVVLNDAQDAASRRLGTAIDAQGHLLEQAADRAAERLAQRLRENEIFDHRQHHRLGGRDEIARRDRWQSSVVRLAEAGTEASAKIRGELDLHAASLNEMAAGLAAKVALLNATIDAEGQIR